MSDISIIAEVKNCDGELCSAVCFVKVDHIEWHPMDAGHAVPRDAVPYNFVEVTVSAGPQGIKQQVTPAHTSRFNWSIPPKDQVA